MNNWEQRQNDFQKSIQKYIGKEKREVHRSIGLLQEKTLHTVVKDFYAPSEDAKEIPINNYVADIYYDHQIIEIQNGNFGKLRDKLLSFLPEYQVTVVYPMPYRKWTIWINPDTGELTKPHRTPAIGTPFRGFKELYRIKTFLNHPNFRLVLLMIDFEEYRVLDGWSYNKKRGSHRHDRIPISLEAEYILNTPADYIKMIPDMLPEPFTGKELAKAVKLPASQSSEAMNILYHIGALLREGKKGNAYTYIRNRDALRGIVSNLPVEEANVYRMLEGLHVSERQLIHQDYHKSSKIMEKGAINEMSSNKKGEETVIERFLRYVKVDTQSNEKSDTSPSTMKQHDLAKILEKDLKAIGAADVFYDKEHCYLYATIPSNLDQKAPKVPVIGFIAHMDTSDAVTGKNVNPRIIENYDGKDIVLNEKEKIILSPKDFPELLFHKKESLIVTDGTTLLGADDKAGISEILTMAAYLIAHPEIKHGDLRICFTPDEEVGEGTRYFDLDRFGADFAYTVDGGKLGELEYENFNAAEAELIIHGRSVHPGDAKGKMRNATLIAYEFQSMLPVFDNPMYTQGREGFYHLTLMKGTCDMAVVYYIIRDHDLNEFSEKKNRFKEIVSYLNHKYGEGTIELTMEDSYYNMIEKIKPHMHLIENARKAMQEAGVTPIENPIRGGTDGAALSFRGLPCPNLCTGGYNYHGKYEYASVQEMEKVVAILINLVQIYGAFELKKSSAKISAKKAVSKNTAKTAKAKSKAVPKKAVTKKTVKK